MSVLIKGMEMPKNCWQCPMVGGYELSDEVKARYSTLHCRLLRCKTPSGVKPNNCPLVPVPPHGRLIDADALMLKIQDYIEEYGDVDERGLHNLKWCAMKEAEMAINDAETVFNSTR